jgi:ATP-dependent exoDNAse (exonuclease V) alpha subunit
MQFIFIGDINQLPPIFGPAILGFKMNSLPVVELTQVYRQALESPIIRLAHRILSGTPIPVVEFPEWHHKNQLTIHPWKKRISADNALLTLAAFFKRAVDSGNYSPLEDMILIPFNKACGTDELNKHIANHLARKANAVTYEIIAGYNKHYLSVGEKVLYEKEDAIVVDICRNRTYLGKNPQPASPLLDYWGCVQESTTNKQIHHITKEQEQISEEDMDAIMEKLANSNPEDRVRDASHIVTVEIQDTKIQVELKAAAEINALIMSYALTVHKSQGSEWRKVFLALHQSHNTMIQRELLYTAITRAREELYVICEPDSFEKGITGQRIKGNTLAEKAEYFKGKLDGDAGGMVASLLGEMDT